MNKYRQLTSEERHTLSTLRKQGYQQAAIARVLGRHRSTISREVRRNSKDRGGRVYRPDLADDYARWRRGRSRRNERFGPSDWRMVVWCLKQQWSPEQAAGWLRRKRQLSISHETIYRHIWRDRKQGGRLYLHLRCSPKQRRKRYGRYDSRGRLAGKRPISERPAGAENRSRVGHLEADTVIGCPTTDPASRDRRDLSNSRRLKCRPKPSGLESESLGGSGASPPGSRRSHSSRTSRGRPCPAGWRGTRHESRPATIGAHRCYPRRSVALGSYPTPRCR